jgi:hypothetical protein
MAKEQSAIEWLEEAGVDCSELRKKLNALSESHAEKRITGPDGSERTVAGASPGRALVEGIFRQFVTDGQVQAKLIEELVEEFEAEHQTRPVVDLKETVA